MNREEVDLRDAVEENAASDAVSNLGSSFEASTMGEEGHLGIPLADGDGNGHSGAQKGRRRGRQSAGVDMEEMIEIRKRMRETRLEEAVKKFERPGREARLGKIKNRAFADGLRREQEFQKSAAEASARAEILLTESEGFLEPENDMEKTYKVSQKNLMSMADRNTASKLVDLHLPNFAPYRVSWTRNGRYMLLGGRRGHISVVDALRVQPRCEIHVNETVRDATFLHDQTMFAVAQKKHIFIYDDNGAEIHRLKSHIRPDRIEFLPYHFLLVSVGRGGWLKYQDTSTGALVSEHRTKLGPCNVMTQNPHNAIMCLGHGNGTVTMWSPSMAQPLIKMFCHNAAVGAIAVNHEGHEMVTAGLDGKLSVWDVRTCKRLHSYHTPHPPKDLDISQTGLLAVSCGYQVNIWKDAIKTKAQSPYMRHTRPGSEYSNLSFRPYEDILGLGHSSGVETMLVPGSGIANYDAFEANPFETTRQRREGLVHRLLEKIQPEMITLDPTTIGKVTATPQSVLKAEEEESRAANAKPKREKNKMKGRSKIGKKLKRQHKNIVTAERERLRKKLEDEKAAKRKARDGGHENSKTSNPLFQRFYKPKDEQW